MAPNAMAAIMILGALPKYDSKTNGDDSFALGAISCGPGANKGNIPKRHIIAPAKKGAQPEIPNIDTKNPPSPKPAAKEIE